jgi:hypothetical protein
VGGTRRQTADRRQSLPLHLRGGACWLHLVVARQVSQEDQEAVTEHAQGCLRLVFHARGHVPERAWPLGRALRVAGGVQAPKQLTVQPVLSTGR